jgi:selenide, water dikinase
VQSGAVTGASARNWQSYGEEVLLAPYIDSTLQIILTDPQTSGGLLIACDPNELPAAREVFVRHGMGAPATIGRLCEGGPKVRVD